MSVSPDRRVVVVLASARRRGAEIQGASLAESLAERGHDVRVVALVPGDGSAPLDVPVLGTSARSLSTLRALRRRIRGAVVVAHGSTTLPAVALAAAGASATPWVYRSIGDPAAWVRNRAHRERTGLLMRRADAVVTLWDAASTSIHDLYRVPTDRLFTVPNHRTASAFPPIDVTERESARREWDVRGPTALLLGSISDEKCPLDAVRAIARVPGASLVVAGVGPLADEVARLADELAPGRVRLVGETADPSRLMAAVDVLVLPSRTEGMPGVVIEAQLRGLPVVASDVGAVRDMVRHGIDGFVHPVGDVEAASAGIRAVLAEPQRFRATATRSAADRYDVGVVVSAWESVLATVVGRRTRPR